MSRPAMLESSTSTNETSTTGTDRLVQIGDLVWLGVEPQRHHEAAVVPLPSIVIRVLEPRNPASPVAVQVFRGDRALQSNVPYSADLAVMRWSWPPPPPAPPPAW